MINGGQKWAGRASTLATLTMVGALALSGVAIADDITNNIDATVDAEAETMALNVGGPTGSTNLSVVSRNADGKNGCNLTGNTSLGLTVASSNAAVATVSPSSVTFTSCGEAKVLIMTAVTAGSATISVAQTSNSTDGSFNLAPATFTVNVSAPAPANTAPTTTVTGVETGASYGIGSVPPARCAVTDAEDGNSSFPASLSGVTGMYASDGIGSQTASCSFTDGGGLDASGSVTYNIVDLSAPEISYEISPPSPDGANGWYTSDVSLTWTVSDLESPNSLQTAGCVDQDVTADQAATSYSCSATSAGGSSGPVSVSVRRDVTAPTVSYAGVVSGTAGTDGWYTSDVVVSFTATDNLSGPATASQTVTANGDSAGVSVASPAFTDGAGNSRPAGAAVSPVFKIDSHAPNAPTASLTPVPNRDVWNNSDVVVSFTEAGDNGPSGVASCTAAVAVNVETASQTVAGTCTDHAGNISPATNAIVKLDKTAPVVADTVTVTGIAGSNGWYTTDVEVSFTATDVLSGPTTHTQTVSSSGEGAAVSVASPAFTDIAGNTTAAGDVTKGYKIDKSAPSTPTFTGGPASSYYFGSDPAEPTCDSTDSVSGIASCVVTGGGSSVGSHSYTATATDRAGNTSTAELNYTVLAWTLQGFYSPVNMDGVWNTVKGGSTVPLKFELFAGATELTNTSSIKSFTITKIICTSGAGIEDAIEVVTTGGTSLRYDSTGGQFVQNWKTPTGANTCYRLTMTTTDGSTLTALFKIK